MDIEECIDYCSNFVNVDKARNELLIIYKALIAQEVVAMNERCEDILPIMERIGETNLYMSGDDLNEWAARLRKSAITILIDIYGVST